jgi:hypothetical protein
MGKRRNSGKKTKDRLRFEIPTTKLQHPERLQIPNGGSKS